MRTLYETIERMPLYPFTLGNVSAFLGSVLSPIAMLALESLVSKLVG